MPTSSSVNPERGVVPATEFLAGNTGKETWPTGAVEGFASLLRTQDEVDALCHKYGIPKDFPARPAGDLRANATPPPGAICVYARALEAGMRVPLHGFFRGVLAHFGIAPAQLTPNGWRFMAGFLVLCRSAGVPPSLAVFLRFFHLSILDQKQGKGWYFFRSRRGTSSLGFTGFPNAGSKSILGWKGEFFFLSSPEPWHCAVEWGEPSKGSFVEPELTVEEKISAVKLLSAHGGAAIDLRNLLPVTWSRRRRRRRLCNSNPAVSTAMITTASPPPAPSSARITCCSKVMDPSVYDMMKTMLADKAGAQATASVKKRTWEEANILPLSVLSPPQQFPSRHDGHTADWDGVRERLQDTVAPPSEPSGDAAIRREEKLELARERDHAARREQLQEAKNELASAKWAADRELDKAKAELAAAGAELDKTKAELAAAGAELDKTKAELAAAGAELDKTKAELAATKRSAEAELVQAKAELTAAKRAAKTELVKAKAKLAAVEGELERAKAAAAVQQLLDSEEQVRQRAEDALEGYKRWRGHHAPAGRAA